MTRVTTDVTCSMSCLPPALSRAGDVSFLGVLIIIFYLNLKLALVAMSVIPLIILITIVFKIKARDSYRRVRTAIARINSFLQEHITGISVVQLFSHEQRSFDKFETINREHLKANLNSVMACSFSSSRRDCDAIAVALIIWYGGGQFSNANFPLERWSRSFNIPRSSFAPSPICEKYNILQSAMASSERIFKLWMRPLIFNHRRTRCGWRSQRRMNFAMSGLPITERTQPRSGWTSN